MDTAGNEHAIESYLRKQYTEVLENIIRDDFEGRKSFTLDVLLTVCKILAERHTHQKSTEEMFHQCCHAPEIEDL